MLYLTDTHFRLFTRLWKPNSFKKIIYHTKNLKIQQMDAHIQNNNIIFIGDSLISGLDVSVVHPLAVNFGIGGDTTEKILHRIKSYNSLKKVETVFLNIGINDLLQGKAVDEVYSNIKIIIKSLNRKVFLGSIHPLDERVKISKEINNKEIKKLNEKLASFCKTEENCFFVDSFSYLIDHTGNLDSRYHINDGLHLSPAGYEVWMVQIRLALRSEQ